LQGADWHQRLEARRGEIASELDELSKSALVRRVIDLGRLEKAINNWPRGDWHKAEIFCEYNLALTRGLAGGRFIRWIEAANCAQRPWSGMTSAATRRFHTNKMISAP